MECDLGDAIQRIIVPKKETNPKSLKLFYSLILPYVAVLLYAFLHYNSVRRYIPITLEDFYEASRVFTFVVFFFAIVTTILYLLIISKMSKFFIIIGIALKCILFITSYVFLAHEYVRSYTVRQNPWIFFLMCLLCFWSFYVNQFAISRIGINLTSQLIKESCRAINECSYLILLATISSILVYVVIGLTIGTTCILMSEVPFLGGFCVLINVIYGLWLICFVITFTGLVCSKTFSTWFFTADKALFSKITTIENIVFVARYHLGTVAYASSLWSVVPLIYHLIKNVVKKERDTRYNIFVLISCYLSTFWTLSSNCCIVTATKGKSYEKSIDAASQLYLKYPLQVHAINKAVCWCLMYASLLIIALYCFISVVIYESRILSRPESGEFAVAIFVTIIVSITPGIQVVLTAVVTITFCIFENYEYEKRNKIETNYTNSKLKDLVLKE